MKLKVLADNNTIIDQYYIGEPAVSYYIEDGNDKILFDTGYSDIFIKNAEKMNIDLSKINKIVISHGHNDHTGGLKYYFESIKNNDVKLIAHPGCFEEKYCDDEYIGTSMSKEDLCSVCNLMPTEGPMQISDNIVFLGEIPQINDFEKREIIGKHRSDGKFEDDLVNDDSAIVYKSEDGLFTITGCSHSGICNIIEYAKRVLGDDRIVGVIGGMHLFECNERLEKTIAYFENNKIKKLYPCHCVSLKAKIEMGKRMEIQEVGVGMEVSI